jgi:hypothetical protein
MPDPQFGQFPSMSPGRSTFVCTPRRRRNDQYSVNGCGDREPLMTFPSRDDTR